MGPVTYYFKCLPKYDETFNNQMDLIYFIHENVTPETPVFIWGLQTTNIDGELHQVDIKVNSDVLAACDDDGIIEYLKRAKAVLVENLDTMHKKRVIFDYNYKLTNCINPKYR